MVGRQKLQLMPNSAKMCSLLAKKAIYFKWTNMRSAKRGASGGNSRTNPEHLNFFRNAVPLKPESFVKTGQDFDFPGIKCKLCVCVRSFLFTSDLSNCVWRLFFEQLHRENKNELNLSSFEAGCWLYSVHLVLYSYSVSVFHRGEKPVAIVSSRCAIQNQRKKFSACHGLFETFDIWPLHTVLWARKKNSLNIIKWKEMNISSLFSSICNIFDVILMRK